MFIVIQSVAINLQLVDWTTRLMNLKCTLIFPTQNGVPETCMFQHISCMEATFMRFPCMFQDSLCMEYTFMHVSCMEATSMHFSCMKHA